MTSLEAVLDADSEARALASQAVARRAVGQGVQA
jgi:hypothetical protein